MKKFEYTKAISKYYDKIYDSMRSPVDLKFYLDEISKAAGPVLEIGAGTGRIFIDALKSGADIYGIDTSETMLEILKGKLNENDFKRISFADARDFKFDKKFDLIIMPFRVLSHIIEIEDQLKIFKNAYTHLNDGGRFIFDVFLPNPAFLTNGRETVIDFNEAVPEGNLMRETTIKPDYVNQINNIIFKYTFENDKEKISDTNELPMRYFFRFEIEHLLQRSGFYDYNVFGDFQRNPLENGKWEIVVEAYRKS